MPKAVEDKLKKEAEAKFPGDVKRQHAYVFGTLRRQGWKPKGKNNGLE
jgi:hypothetical protein